MKIKIIITKVDTHGTWIISTGLGKILLARFAGTIMKEIICCCNRLFKYSNYYELDLRRTGVLIDYIYNHLGRLKCRTLITYYKKIYPGEFKQYPEYFSRNLIVSVIVSGLLPICLAIIIDELNIICNWFPIFTCIYYIIFVVWICKHYE